MQPSDRVGDQPIPPLDAPIGATAGTSAILHRLLAPPKAAEAFAKCFTAPTSEDLFAHVAEVLVHGAPSDFAYLGELCGERWDRIKVLAVATPMGLMPTFEYDLADTPCASVIGRAARVYSANVRELFPRDQLLIDLEIESYAAIPLLDVNNRPLGILGMLGRRPLADSAFAVAALELFAGRMASELEHRTAVRELRLIIEGVAGPSSDDSLRSLVRNLARLLHVHTAFVSQLIDPEHTRARTLALWHRDRFLPAVDYALAGTPCEQVYGADLCFHANDVQQVFPQDDLLRRFDAQGYLGIPFFSSTGQPIGHLGVMHDAPLSDTLHATALFRVFAARAGAEIQRRLAEEQRLEAQQQLAQTQKLESLGVLAGGLAHDFNNLLVGILGNTSLALLETPATSPLRSYLTEIEHSARGCADLARQMLAFSGKGRFVVEPLDLSSLVADTLRMVRASIPDRIAVQLALANDLPTVQADATQLRQLVMNLVLNASEAIGERAGQIQISTGIFRPDRRWLRATAVGQDLAVGDYVMLTVTDNGCGMDDATRNKIFEPFFTTKFRGRGLGMAATQGVVRSHGGALRVDSEPGKGSTFRLLLPFSGCQPRTAPVAEAAPAAPPWRGDGLVLLIDDEAAVRIAGARLLQSLGFTPIVVSDGPTAIETFRHDRDRIRAVLVDLGMPSMDGVTCMQRLRELDAHVPVLLMSGFDQQEVLPRLRDVKPTEFLTKPFGIDELQAKLQRALELHPTHR